MYSYCRKNDLLPLRVGALLYTPATNGTVADKLIDASLPDLCSLTFCLEDAIMDNAVYAAEIQLQDTLSLLARSKTDDFPLLFVRVRSPQHLLRVHGVLGGLEDLLTGYVFPKFDTDNMNAYLDVFWDINAERNKPLYFMPILESTAIAKLATRESVLESLYSTLNCCKESVLNIRVGGNDLCSQFGIRRAINQTIYDVGVVRDVLVDILNVFCGEYVVSGPVWDYYGIPGEQWELGLREELQLDTLNGFIGKTAVHPCQLPAIKRSLMVNRGDYEDAKLLVNWNKNNEAVGRGYEHHRMNELKCHSKWAQKILCLAEIYGVCDGD